MSLADMSVEEFMGKEWGDSSSCEENEEKGLTPKKTVKAKKKKKTIKKKPKAKLLEKSCKVDTSNNDECMEVSQSEEQDRKVSADVKDTSSGHQKQLDILKEKDPDFYKFLQEEDSNLLDFQFDEEELDLSSEDDEEDIFHHPPEKLEEASDSDYDIASSGEEDISLDKDDIGLKEHDSKKVKKRKRELITVTEEMIEGWKTRLICKEPSRKALHQLIQAFHATLARIEIEEPKTEKKHSKRRARPKTPQQKYKLMGSATFNAVVGMCLQSISPTLSKLLDYHPESSTKTKKKKAPLPMTSPKWQSVSDDLKFYLNDVITLSQSLLEPSVVRALIRHHLLMLPYFVAFPKVAKLLLNVLIKFWSTSDNESVRVLAFLCISRLIRMRKGHFCETAMKHMYLNYVSNSKFTSRTTLPLINFMQRSFAEICAVDTSHTYKFAFVYIRQLAIHLRKAITTKEKESRHAVYNWQYIHSISLWCRVLSVLHPNDALQPLIYPLVQVALGVIDLVPTARFFPLRFCVIQQLIALGDCTNVYIPLLPLITHPLTLMEFKKKQFGMSVRPLQFDTMLKLSNSQLKEKAYRDGTIDHLYDLLMAYFNSQSHTVAFPEMSVPTLMMLKKFIKECKTPNYCKILRQVVERVQENSKFIQTKRSEITFDVKDIDAVAAWEVSLKESGVPFHTFYAQYKKQRQREVVQMIADKGRVVEENLPQIDREKFMNKSKLEDKKELEDLFADYDDDDDDDAAVNFEKAIEDSKSGKRSKKFEFHLKREVTASDEDDEVEEEEEEEVEEEEVEDDKNNEDGGDEVKSSIKRVDLGDDEDDIVEELTLSDID